jgi:hypothetical protein
MANKGWDQQQGGGSSWVSNERTTGRVTSTDGGEGFIKGSRIAHPSGGDNDPLDSPSDRFEAPGQMHTTSCEH